MKRIEPMERQNAQCKFQIAKYQKYIFDYFAFCILHFTICNKSFI